MKTTNFDYVREKLQRAVYNLVVGPGDVRSRLKIAYMSFHTLRKVDFPPELQSDWSWVLKQLTRFGPAKHYSERYREGSVSHTLGRIRNKTGQKIAERIYYLYMEMQKYRQVAV